MWSLTKYSPVAPAWQNWATHDTVLWEQQKNSPTEELGVNETQGEYYAYVIPIILPRATLPKAH